MKQVRMMAVFAALCLLLPAFVSCDKDEDDPNGGNEPIEEPIDVSKIFGTYSGSLGWKVMTTEDMFTDVYDLIISDDNDDDDVTVTLPQCTFTPPIENARPFTIPSLEVNDVDVEKAGNGYSISADDFVKVIDGVNYTGKIEGTVDGNNVKIYYTLIPGIMPMPINFTFTGTLK